MNLGILGKSLTLTLSVALILYGLSGYLVHQGIAIAAFFADVWKLVALSIGLSIVTAAAYPHIRGVREGDQMVAFVRRDHVVAGVRQQAMDVVFATAMESGKVGQKIRIAVGNGIHAEGRITSYGGTFSPATLKITETERAH